MRSAQVCPKPLLMAVNFSSVGGDASPSQLLPQQTGEPSERSAQVCLPPLLMAMTFSDGRARPLAFAWPRLLSPQQTGEPWVRSAQVWEPAAADGYEARTLRRRCLASVFTRQEFTVAAPAGR